MTFSTFIWFLVVVYAILFIRFSIVIYRDEGLLSKYMENGFSESGMYGMTPEVRKELKKQKKYFFLLIIVGFILFFAYVIYDTGVLN